MNGITRYSSLFLFGLYFLIFGCDTTDTKSSTNNDDSNKELLPDSLLSIVDEIGLCEGWHSEAEGHTGTCNASIHTKIVKIKPHDVGYRDFAFEGRGGSGGKDLRIYRKVKDEYELIQTYFGLYDTIIPTEITNGYYDLYLAFKDYDRGIVRAKFNWNGKKYVLDQVISVSGVPMKILEKVGITDQKKCIYVDSSGLMVSEHSPFDEHAYVPYLSINLCKGNHTKLVLSESGEMGFAFFLSSHYSDSLISNGCSIWLFKDDDENYEFVQKFPDGVLTSIPSNTKDYYDLLLTQYLDGEETMIKYKWTGNSYTELRDTVSNH